MQKASEKIGCALRVVLLFEVRAQKKLRFMAKRADNIAEKNATKENCFYFSKILKFSILYTGMGYALFFVCRVSNKAAGLFCSLSLVACCGKQGLINEFFAKKTDEKKQN